MRSRRFAIADWQLVTLACALSAFGIAMLYSAGQVERTTAFAGLWRTQLGWLVLGMCVAFAVSRASPRLIELMSAPVYVVSVVLLLVLMIGLGSGAGTAESTKSWLTIGGRRLGQPSELAKIAVVLMLAKTLTARRETPHSLVDLWKPTVIAGIPWVLVMSQPDLGTAMVLIGLYFAMLYWTGASWRLLLLVASPGISLVLAFSTELWGAWFLLLLALLFAGRRKPYVVDAAIIIGANLVLGVGAPRLWDSLKDYQKDRLIVFLNPEKDARAAGYNIIQSQVAIGSGGWFGKGYTQGTQKRLSFLPQHHTDFIFPVIGEELGFAGVMAGLGGLCLLLLRAVRIATRSLDPFTGIVAFGLAAGWFVHVIVNIGMTVGLMPITGIPLPFFSYGGSFMLACWISVGLLVRISAAGRGRADAFAI
jgi:rod shape determining protein RodA